MLSLRFPGYRVSILDTDRDTLSELEEWLIAGWDYNLIISKLILLEIDNRIIGSLEWSPEEYHFVARNVDGKLFFVHRKLKDVIHAVLNSYRSNGTLVPASPRR